jgi:probable H4MPT-linked C1 transfer pathway protein
MNWLALDIGGANIKVADGRGYVASYSFPLWQEPSRLAQQIRTAIYESPTSDHLAITMTGELADCFETKAAGVKFILEAVKEGGDNRHTRVYLVDGRFVAPPVAERQPKLAAATNWQALARFAGRYAPQGPALLLDIGSTTCDLIPLYDGEPRPKGKTDTERLLFGEMLYTGVQRSPLCAVLREMQYRGQSCPLTHELFATMYDAYLVLHEMPEDPSDDHTADGKPATKVNARRRLARMIAADETEFTASDAEDLANAAARAQRDLVSTALQKVVSKMPQPPETMVLSGHGDFLAHAALRNAKLGGKILPLSRELGTQVSRCATAHALAVLALAASGP